MNALTSLQCWAGQSDLSISIVEPVIRIRRILSFTANRKSNDSMALSNYFDIEHFNAVSKEMGYAELTPLDEFDKKGSKNVAYIDTKPHTEKILWTTGESTPSCMRRASAGRNRPLHSLIDAGYCIVRVIIANWKTLTDYKLQELLGEWNNGNVTLVFSMWRGYWHTNTSKCVNIDGTSTIKNQFRPSHRLLQDAKRYEDLYTGLNPTVVAIMIRLEHAVLLTSRNHKYNINTCLDNLVKTYEELKSSNAGIPIITADIGKYGSGSWNKIVKDEAWMSSLKAQTLNTIQVLFNHKMSFERWERSFVEAAGGVTNRGYIAALQRVIASRADCLVLMGGGSFQDLALQDYIHFHKDRDKWCIHLICAHNEALLRQRMEKT